MTRINKLTLISDTYSGQTDDIGQPEASTASVDIIAEVREVTQSEYIQGKQDGLSPVFVFRISSFIYSGQRIAQFNGDRYSIYRTYQPDENYIELYVEREVGATGEVVNEQRDN